MTYEEARALLTDMRNAKRRTNAIKKRIADLESDSESIQSALGGDSSRATGFHSRVESLAVRIQSEREKHIQALEAYFELEDKLSAAIDTLPEIEREIILAFYLDGNTNWKVGEIIGYDARTVIRKKNAAVKKIADNL